jgi:hypothetical protein
VATGVSLYFREHDRQAGQADACVCTMQAGLQLPEADIRITRRGYSVETAKANLPWKGKNEGPKKGLMRCGRRKAMKRRATSLTKCPDGVFSAQGRAEHLHHHPYWAMHLISRADRAASSHSWVSRFAPLPFIKRLASFVKLASTCILQSQSYTHTHSHAPHHHHHHHHHHL